MDDIKTSIRKKKDKDKEVYGNLYLSQSSDEEDDKDSYNDNGYELHFFNTRNMIKERIETLSAICDFDFFILIKLIKFFFNFQSITQVIFFMTVVLEFNLIIIKSKSTLL